MEAYVRKTLKQLRQWDHVQPRDYFIANSHNVPTVSKNTAAMRRCYTSGGHWAVLLTQSYGKLLLAASGSYLQAPGSHHRSVPYRTAAKWSAMAPSSSASN